MQRITKENINTKEYWENYFDNPGYKSNVRKTGIVRYEEIVKKLSDRLPKTFNILEVGCNFGDFYKYLNEINFKTDSYIGVDFSSRMIEDAKNNFPNAEWICKDCYSLPFPDNSFDIVIAMQMLEHIDNVDTFLSESYRILKNNGNIYITVPNELKIRHASHCWSFSEYDIKLLLSNSKYRGITTNIINSSRNILGIGGKHE